MSGSFGESVQPLRSRPLFAYQKNRLLEADLDQAMKRGDIIGARVLSELNLEAQKELGPSLALARAYMKSLSVPRLEQLMLLHKGREPYDALADELDGIYRETSEAIDWFLYERNRLDQEREDYHWRRAELVGGTSELTVFGLYNRQGIDSPFITLATSHEDDKGGMTASGDHLGVDLTTYNREAPHLQPVNTQVKTAARPLKTYEKSIFVVATADLAGTSHKAIYALPRAITNEAERTTTKTEQRLLARASRKLAEKTIAHSVKINGK